MPSMSDPTSQTYGPVKPGHDPRSDVDIQFQSGELAVRDALMRLVSALELLELDQEETGTVQLVAAEVLNNIVEHAYPVDSPGGPIRLSCYFQDNGLHLHIMDKGRAMPEGKLPLANRPSLDTDLDDLPEGGFGWFMIQDLAKDVEYSRANEENHLRLRIAIHAPRLN